MADTWAPISGYTPQDYTDTLVFEMSAETKKLEKIVGQALVAGEENSQYIKFVLPRYWDGIDIKDKAFYIEYALAGTYYGKTAAVNAEYNTEQIRFGWVVPKEACCISGTLLFILRIESEDYVLKTQIAEHPVFRSVNVEDVVPEPTKEEWYREFEARVDNAISEAENAISAAQTAQIGAEMAAQNAQTAEANAEAAVAMAQTRYGSPLVAHTAEEMAEQNRVYVYTGSETGYTSGHWYYYNGTEWADGGVYNAVVVDTDTTLSISGKAADAKETGDQITELKSGLNGVNNLESSTLSPAWSQGTISSGTDVISDIRIRTDYIRFQKGAKLSLNIADGYKASVSMYNANKGHLHDKYWLTGDNTLESYADGYIRIVLGKTNDGYVLPSRDDHNANLSMVYAIVDSVNTLIDGGYTDVHIDYKPNGYISKSNGSLLLYDGWKYTDFIKIDDSANGKLLIKLLGPNGNEITTGANFNGWYDTSKKYIGNLAITNQELTIPNNAVYIRLSANNSNTIILQLYLNRVTVSLTDSNNLPYKLFESERVKAKYVPYSVGNNSAESYGGTQYNRANFLFFTDCHIDYFNRLADTQNVKDVVSFANKFPLKFDAIINAGDIITPFGRNTKQSSKEKFAVFTDEVKKLTAPVIFAKGNHDLNDWNNTPANTFTDADWSEMWYDYAESQYGIVRQTKASGEKSTWHYYDIADKKIRIIAVDVQDTDKEKTNADGNVYYHGGVAWYISNEQMNWIVDVALNFDDKTDKNWGVIVVSHQWNYGDYTDDNPKYQDATLKLQHILNAFNTQGTYSIDYTFASDNFFDMNVNADFTRYASETKPPHVICWLLGHEHLDQYKQVEGINIIWTTCGAVDTSGDSRVARVVDTVTQNAFDLISIDTEHRKIRYVRYGAGTNCYGVSGDRFLPDGLSY